jgi:hypothetical protein
MRVRVKDTGVRRDHERPRQRRRDRETQNESDRE